MIRLFLVLSFSLYLKGCAHKTHNPSPKIRSEYQTSLNTELAKRFQLHEYLDHVVEELKKKIPGSISHEDAEEIKIHIKKYSLSQKGVKRRMLIRTRVFDEEETQQVTLKYNAPALTELLAIKFPKEDLMDSKLEQDIYPEYSKFGYSFSTYRNKADAKEEKLQDFKKLFKQYPMLKEVPDDTLVKQSFKEVLRIKPIVLLQGETKIKITLDFEFKDKKSLESRNLAEIIDGEISFKIKSSNASKNNLAMKVFEALTESKISGRKKEIKSPSYFYNSTL